MEPTRTEPAPGYRGVRENAAWIDLDPIQYLWKVSGDGALAFLDHHLPGKVCFLHPFTSAMTAALDAELRIIDLLEIVNLEDHYLVIGSRTAREKVRALLDPDGFDVELTCLGDSHSLLGLEGPYAWRWARETFGSEVLGLGIHAAMRTPGGLTCLRSGCSGEYGYRVVCGRSERAALIEQFQGRHLLPELEREDLALVALETRTPLFGFSIHEGDCPLENDLRYMVDFFKEEPAILERLRIRSAQVGRGVVAFTAKDPVQPGSGITLDGRPVGEVRLAAHSPRLESHFGYAVLDAACAYPGGRGEEARFLCGRVELAMGSSPLLTTLSTTVVKELA